VVEKTGEGRADGGVGFLPNVGQPGKEDAVLTRSKLTEGPGRRVGQESVVRYAINSK
jgi:hypothetical protein